MKMAINTQVNLLIENSLTEELSLVVMASSSRGIWKIKRRLNLLYDATDFG